MTLDNSEHPINPQQSPADAGTEPTGHKGQSDPPITPDVMIPNPPPPPQKHCEITVNTKRDFIDWWTLRLEGFGLFVLMVYTVFTGLMWCANKQAANAAENAANTAANQLELTERPWVFITHSELRSPLTFDKDGGHVTLRFYFRNGGHSPATNVGITPELFMLTNEHPSPSVERDRCNPHGPPPSTPGMILFPNTDTPQDITVGIAKDDMESAAKHGMGTFVTVPIVCITYRPTFKDTWYYTAIVYSLWPTIQMADTKRQGYSIPIRNIPLQQNPFFGEAAD